MRLTKPTLAAIIIVILLAIGAFYMSKNGNEQPAAQAQNETKAEGQQRDLANGLQSLAVVDVVVLMRESAAALSIESQLTKKRNAYQSDLAAQEKKIRTMEEELVKLQRDKKQDSKFNDKRKKFETAVRDLQKNAQKKRVALDKASSKAMNRLQEEITKITAEVANEKNLQLVITREQVVVVAKPLDITADIMAQLNTRLPRVDVTVDDSAAAKSAE